MHGCGNDFLVVDGPVTLDADRVRLEGEIRQASSRARLQPIAEQRLNMHIPAATQQVTLPRRAPHDSL